MQLEGNKYIWKLPELDNQELNHLADCFNLSVPIIQTLLTRGLKDKKSLENYLFSSYDKDVYHPKLLKNAEIAVDRIISAINNNEKILICGDYDVDGITSSAMMMLCLKPLGADVNFFLPNRLKDGYGLSVKTVKRAAKCNYKVLITVDNGISAFEAAQEAKELGLDLIITDHHKPHKKLPNAFAIVNPQQIDCEYPYKTLAGVGVTFKLLSFLYEKLGQEMPTKVYELLVLGTIADVVPLTGENRFWVRSCLKHVNSLESLALKVLKENAKLSKPVLTSLDIGFSLAPQINALGRLEDARQGVMFLIGNNEKQVYQVGAILNELNQARRSIEKAIVEEIEELINQKQINLEKERLISVYSDKWPPGVIGLVASRLVSAYNRPAIVMHKTHDNLLKGSCRSVPEYNMFEALSSQSELLISFGGHAMAAGLALKLEDYAKFKENIEQDLAEKLPVIESKPLIQVDGQITLPETNKKLTQDLLYLEPFGNENKQPIFYIYKASVIDTPILLKSAHLKCKIFADGIIKSIIFFNRPELKDFIEKNIESTFSFLVYVQENHWNDKVSIEFQGIDIALNN